MAELLLCCALLCSHCRLCYALRCCLLLLQLCLLMKHLRSSAFSPLFTGFCHFRIFHTSLSRFGAAFCCLHFAFSLRPLSHLCILGFVTFAFFTLRCQLFFILPCHLYFFIKTCAFSYCLSFLLSDEACVRNVINSTVCCSSGCCSLNYYTSILFVLHKYRNFFSVAHFCSTIVVFSARFSAAFCCVNFAFCWSTYVRPLSHLSLLGFVTFFFSHFAVSYFSYIAITFFLHKLMRFLIPCFISPTWWNLWGKHGYF